MAIDDFHPHDSTIVAIANGTFKGSADSRQNNLGHISGCLLERHEPGQEKPIASCKSKYDAAVRAAASATAASSRGNWLSRLLGRK